MIVFGPLCGSYYDNDVICSWQLLTLIRSLMLRI